MNAIVKQIPNNITIKLQSLESGRFTNHLVHEFNTREYFFELHLTVTGYISEYVNSGYCSPDTGGEIQELTIDFDAIEIWNEEGDKVNLSTEDLYAVQMEINNSLVFEI